MWLIVAALLVGLAVGARGILPEWCLNQLDRVMLVTLLVMLVALGAQIGGNTQLLTSLGLLGWRAVVISTCSIAGSVVVLWMVTRCFPVSGKGDNT
jgi:hypothetical protein